MRPSVFTYTIQFSEHPLATKAPVFPLDGQSGAVIDFYGVVRGEELKRRSLNALSYEAYLEMAQKKMEELMIRLGEKHSCQKAIFIHRVGSVPVGEPSLFLRVFSRHRTEGFQMAMELINELKREIPIWKKAIFS